MVNIKDELLIEGLDDWIDATWTYSEVRSYHPAAPDVLRQLSIGIIAELLSGGLMVAGDMVTQGEYGIFRAWDLSPGDSIVRITNAWVEESPYEKPDSYSIVWLENTDLGKALGEAALASKSD